MASAEHKPLNNTTSEATEIKATQTERRHFDVVISGGGLSGLLTAIGLRHECPELAIAIIDTTASPKHEPNSKNNKPNLSPNETSLNTFDGRHIALSYGSLQLLAHWQIWPALKPLAWPIKTIVTSDKGHFGKTILKSHDFDLNAMGYVSDMRNIGRVFQNQLTQITDNKVTWFNGVEITSLGLKNIRKNTSEKPKNINPKDVREITLSDGQKMSTNLLVVAEGATSKTKDLLGIKSAAQSYQQTAVVVNVQCQGAESKLARLLRRPLPKSPLKNDSANNPNDLADTVAFERFTTHGPIAFLPIGQQQYSVVWTETPDKAADLMALPKDQFCTALQNEFGFAAGKIVDASERIAFPLQIATAQSLTHNRVAILGNAAHTIHPIAGQGFNLGIRDIAVLVNEVALAVQAAKSDQDAQTDQASQAEQKTNTQKNAPNQTGINADIGSFAVLNRYQANRVDDINRVTFFTDSLVRIFGLEGRAPAVARTTGLMALQKFDPLQNWLAKHFMGSQSAKNIPQLTQPD